MNSQRKSYIEQLYQRYHADDAKQTDRLNRWRSIEPESAELLALLIIGKQAKRLLEIGTSGGYSTLWLADAAEQTGGHLTTIEIEAGRLQTATAHLTQVGLSGIVTPICTDALTFLQENKTSYDWILLDAERPAYASYWAYLTECLAEKGSMLVVDNVISHREQVSSFIALVQEDKRFQSTVLPIGAGLFLIVRC
ncbi:MAG: class I SAM-dependent methyltransferase [Neisseria sp.]|uniref:O-methyltransferase n=1 Tax=Neisseria sp. TaxID=192066 RepID=UPI0026DC3121|nr:class I SAM-dependent methyltransferase [Neisseria sp.]MDO4640251.1 class I SAM-dependent methyltransferase [Neisseria sp.]